MRGGRIAEELTYIYPQVVLLIDFLHEPVHFCTAGVGMLPELSWEGDGVHVLNLADLFLSGGGVRNTLKCVGRVVLQEVRIIMKIAFAWHLGSF